MQMDIGTGIAGATLLLSIASIVYTAGFQSSRITQNEKDIAELKMKQEQDSIRKAESDEKKSEAQMGYEIRLAKIELGIEHLSQKIDFFLEKLSKN